jgi:hypothetical protein
MHVPHVLLSCPYITGGAAEVLEKVHTCGRGLLVGDGGQEA